MRTVTSEMKQITFSRQSAVFTWPGELMILLKKVLFLTKGSLETRSHTILTSAAPILFHILKKKLIWSLNS